MKRGAFVLVFATACAGGAAGSGARPPEEKLAPQPTSLNLDRADPAEALSVAEQLLEEPVLVDAMALASLRCIRVTVKEPTPVPRRVAAESLFDAMRGQGLRVDRAGGMWLVSVDQARPPVPCQTEGRETAAEEAADGGAGAGDQDAALREVLGAIREISPVEHAITQRGLELLLENQALLLKMARVVPELGGDAGVAGLRVFGVRAGGVLARLGLENGDRVERVMGKSVATPEQALEAYAAMRGAKAIEIEVTRRGAPMKLMVRVE